MIASRNIYLKARLHGKVQVVFGISLVGLLVASPVQASNKEDAKKHFKAGLTLFKAEDYDAAAAEFEVSAALYETKGGLYNLANCYRALHRYGDALDVLEKVAANYKGKLDKEMSDDVQLQIKELRAVVAALTVSVDKSGAQIVVDGKEVGRSPLLEPLLLAPGEHIVEVSLQDHDSIKRKINILAREKKTVSFDLVPAGADVQPVSSGVLPSEPQEEAPSATEETRVEEVMPVVSDSETEFKETEPQTGATQEKGRLSPVFWTGLIGTAITGIAGGVFWGLAASEEDTYLKHRDAILDLNDRYPTSDDREVLKQEYADELLKAEDAEDLYWAYTYTALGLTIAAGAFAVVTVVGLALHSKEDRKENRITVFSAPGVVQVRF